MALTPARRLLHALLALALLGLAAGIWPALVLLWCGASLALLLAVLGDAMLVRRAPALRIERQLAGVLPVARWAEVALTVHNDEGRALQLELADDYPSAWAVAALPHRTRLAAGSYLTISYQVRPDQRGDAVFGAPHVRLASPLGLWLRSDRLGPTGVVKIFPDFASLLGQSLHLTDRRSPQAGAIRKRRRGEGTDFRQLREYRQGDSQRAIDWKASARYNRPISREYQEERDQQVVFLLDTGRRMLAEDVEGSHFTHALNAVLTLAFVAQKQGDAVGLMSFGGRSRWMTPRKGRVGLDRLLAGVYDLQPDETAPDYTAAAQSLLNQLSKRAFVVLITNLRDEDDHALRSACDLLASKHLVLCASLREKALDVAAAAPVEHFAAALQSAASHHYLQQRSAAIKRLGLRSSHLIDITPAHLSQTLVNRYHDIKESGRL